MPEFSTSALLEIEVSQSSLKNARSTIQSELGNTEVDVNATASNQLNQQNRRPAGKERAMSRSLLTDQTTHLKTTTDRLAENLDLNRERNDLLRDIRDAQEMTARESGGGRSRLGRISGGIGLAGAGLVVAGSLASSLASVSWGQTIGNAIPDVDIGPRDVIGPAATIGVADLINSAANLSPGDVVSAAEVTASNLINSAANLSPGDVVSSVALSAADVVSSVTLTATDVVSSVPLTATDVVKEVALDAGDVVKPVSLKPGDIIDVPSGGLPLGKIIMGAIGAGSAAALLSTLGGGGSAGSAATAAASGTAAAVTPLAALPVTMALAGATGKDSVGQFTQSTFGDDWGSSATGGERGGSGQGVGPIEGFLARLYEPLTSTGSGSGTTTASSGRNDMSSSGDTIEIQNDVTVDASGKDEREVNRIVDDRLREFKNNLGTDLKRM